MDKGLSFELPKLDFIEVLQGDSILHPASL